MSQRLRHSPWWAQHVALGDDESLADAIYRVTLLVRKYGAFWRLSE